MSEYERAKATVQANREQLGNEPAKTETNVLTFPNDHPNAQLRGKEYRHKTYGEMADELKERLMRDCTSGDARTVAYANDMLTILAIAMGMANEPHPENVVLTDEAAADYEEAELQRRLAQLRKQRGAA